MLGFLFKFPLSTEKSSSHWVSVCVSWITSIFGPSLHLLISGGLELSEPENGLELMQKSGIFHVSVPKALPVPPRLSELSPSAENTSPKGISLTFMGCWSEVRPNPSAWVLWGGCPGREHFIYAYTNEEGECGWEENVEIHQRKI